MLIAAERQSPFGEPCLQPRPRPPACREATDYGLNASQFAADV